MRFAVTQSSIGRNPFLHEVGLLYELFWSTIRISRLICLRHGVWGLYLWFHETPPLEFPIKRDWTLRWRWKTDRCLWKLRKSRRKFVPIPYSQFTRLKVCYSIESRSVHTATCQLQRAETRLFIALRSWWMHSSRFITTGIHDVFSSPPLRKPHGTW